ncbi:LETM1 domain-containing protein 1 isoform X2 [Caloenas nicobarica]|uniref:LETM1 domain-containing protein 1 isoform X2 n=1 Tax=Caloenas nicobarica TaxID=187106 RepID=UPI0032B74D30
MALSGLRCRGLVWRLRPGPGPGLSGPRGLPRAPLCCFSSRGGPGALAAAVTAAAKRVTGAYERFLRRRFPRVYVLHQTFTSGIQALVLEVKEIRKIRQKMSQQRLSVQQLPYRDMERLRQFRRDLLKVLPVLVLAIPPFANFLVIVLMYFFPRQLLIRHFWTPQQRRQFLELEDSVRRGAYAAVLANLALAAPALPDPRLREQLRELCQQVQGGAQPRVSQLRTLRGGFSGRPLALETLRAPHARALSRALFLTPLLPLPLLRRRLRSHVLELRELDRALLRLGLEQLDGDELRAACYLRGLNPARLEPPECRAWLERWLRLSGQLAASEASLLAHSTVLLALNPGRA